MLLFAQLFDGWVFESPSNFSCLQIKSEFLSSASHYWSQKQNLDLWNLHYNECIINFFFFSVMEKIDVLEIIWLSSLWKMSVNKRKKSFKVCGLQYCYMLGQIEPSSLKENKDTENSIKTKWLFVRDKLMCRLLGTHPEWHRNLLLILL